MVVRIGEHGVWECSADVWECSEDFVRPAHFAATAKLLFGAALSGRYREEIWTDSAYGPIRRWPVVLHGRFTWLARTRLPLPASHLLSAASAQAFRAGPPV